MANEKGTSQNSDSTKNPEYKDQITPEATAQEKPASASARLSFWNRQQWLNNPLNRRGAALYWSALFTLSVAIIHLAGLIRQPPPSALFLALLLAGGVFQAIVALTVLALPTRRVLLTAGILQACALLIWYLARTTGIPDGFTFWQPETLSIPDLYLPWMEGLSAFFFLCLFGRTLPTSSRIVKVVLLLLPSLLIAGLLILFVIKFAVAQVILATFVLDAGLPISLQSIFLPITVLLLVFLCLRLFVPRLKVGTPHAGRTALILLPALLIVNILTWTGVVNAANTAWFPTNPTIQARTGQLTTLEYCKRNGSPLAMDISEPSARAARPAPVVFYIHGGEDLQGDRAVQDGSPDAPYFAQLRTQLVNRGFVVGSIDYGLAPLNSIGDSIVAAKCAVRFLRANATELGINPQRIGVYGPSQGGYLSSALGTMGPQAGFDTGQYMDQSSSVQAVVDLFGPTDLTDFSGSPSWVSNLKQGLTGGKGTLASARKESPINYVAANNPPFLIIHGADDWFIAPHHSQKLAKMLQAAGVPVTLVMVQHDGHGLAAPTAGQVEQPAPATLVDMITNFFVKTLAS